MIIKQNTLTHYTRTIKFLFEKNIYNKYTFLTLYSPGGQKCPLLPKFQFYFKKRSSKKFPMSVAPMSRETKRAYLRLCPEKEEK